MNWSWNGQRELFRDVGFDLGPEGRDGIWKDKWLSEQYKPKCGDESTLSFAEKQLVLLEYKRMLEAMETNTGWAWLVKRSQSI